MSAQNRMTVAEYRANIGLGAVEPAPVRKVESMVSAPIKHSKFRSIRTEGPSPIGPQVFASKAEAKMARELESEREAGLIVAWAPQVSLPVGVDEKGRNVRYVADALVVFEVLPDGCFVGRFMDRKGHDTPTSRTKRAAARKLYGLDVQILK